MTTILLLTASPRSNSFSTRLAGELAGRLRAKTPGAGLIHRDLGSQPLAHIDGVYAAAIRKPAEARTEAEARSAERSDELVREFLAADVVVIGTGLINFHVDSTLKTWIDHIARAGQTFRYTERGPVGMVDGKKVYVVLSSGGIYTQGPAAALDHAAPYLKAVLGFWGVTDVEVVRVEGVSAGADGADKAVAAARSRIDELMAVMA